MELSLLARQKAQLCAERARLARDPMMHARWWANANAWAIVADHLEMTQRIIEGGGRLKPPEFSAEQPSSKVTNLAVERLNKTDHKLSRTKETLDQAFIKSAFNVIRSKRGRRRRQSKESRPPAPRLTVFTTE
jgi:hypothetical protein